MSPKKILIIDDEERNRRVLQTLVEAEGHQADTLASGLEAVNRVHAFRPDLILLDVMMPGMNGYQVARLLKGDTDTATIPIVMVTALDDRESRLRGLEAGAADFLNKPIDRSELRVRLRNHLRLKEYSDLLNDHNRLLEAQVKERTHQLVSSHQETIQVLTRAAAYKDEETGAHVTRIGLYTEVLAQALGLDTHFCGLILYASPMHDVGKIAVPDAILTKPGPFTEGEWKIMKTHAALGAKLLSGSVSPYLAMGAEIAWCHHERWDGTGYPRGLAERSIPMSARIMNICDQYDALRSARPYKSAFSHERTMEIICQGDGRTMPHHFAPEVLRAFQTCAPRFREIFNTHAEGPVAPPAGAPPGPWY